jgi:acyl-CoA dehydrogenase
MIRDAETLNALLDSVRALCANAWCRPRRRWPKPTRSRRHRADMKAMGLFGLTIPEEYGGLALTMEEEVLK